MVTCQRTWSWVLALLGFILYRFSIISIFSVSLRIQTYTESVCGIESKRRKMAIRNFHEPQSTIFRSPNSISNKLGYKNHFLWPAIAFPYNSTNRYMHYSPILIYYLLLKAFRNKNALQNCRFLTTNRSICTSVSYPNTLHVSQEPGTI